uniref:anthranilate synthase n=1 Tax=Hildenbrandia rubra TaxID=31481 RepID=A0A1C9CG64_9FLOR|nr:glutamine amidotransferase [Hildenbrandia rubra]AOM67371.1 glutamine amidotransferase [Hildenbrandia rubra]
MTYLIYIAISRYVNNFINGNILFKELMKINVNSPFALIQKLDSDEFLYLDGEIKLLDNINQIKTPPSQNFNKARSKYTSLTMVPFHQAYEKGYRVHRSDDKIISLNIKSSNYCSFVEVLDSFQWTEFSLQDLNFEISNIEYKNLIQKIIGQEIANGEGCNFVIPRNIRGKIEDVDIHQVLTIFASLVKQDYGTYWKFIFYTGDRYFIGSTPERHLEIIDDEVRMNPVSGTLFKKEYFKNKALFKRDLISFLNDSKEINELFMVLEEELKMMCKIQKKGGMVIGPILKEMSKLIHTEYLLNGIYDKDNLSILDILRESLFATTVTGSPLENAFNIIHKYEQSPRKYYGSSVVLIGTNSEGKQTLDSPILIRTLDIKKSGYVFLGVGSTLVKDSDSQKELEETFVKSEALLNSLYQNNEVKIPRVLSNCMNDDDIHLNLQKRNQELSKFWFFQQHNSLINQIFSDKKVVIVNNEDDFCYMLAHLLNKMGFNVRIISYRAFSVDIDTDVYIIGPGPGNPNDSHSYKMSHITSIISQIQDKKFLAICLGHQLLCKLKGFNCRKLSTPMQGEKKLVHYFGKQYLLGFYNTFIPRYQKLEEYKNSLQFSLDENCNIIALRGNNFTSMQFHPESILSEYGYDILRQELIRIL